MSNSVDSAINQMVANSAAGRATINEGGGSTTINGEFNTDTGLTVHSAPAHNGRIDDDGIDTRATARQLHERLADFDAQLAATDGHDPVTGQPRQVLTGDRRRIVQLQRDSLAKAIPYQLSRFKQLDAQRAADAAAARNGLTKHGGFR
jgi:hypothetical protein